MKKDKTTISNASSYRAIGEFWDDHDLSNFEQQAPAVEFDVELTSSRIYVPLDKKLAEQLRTAADAFGMTPEALLNRWLEEKIAERK